VTVLSTGLADQREDAAVIVIDLRASATGPDAADPASIDERTLEERQRRSQDSGAGASSGWRLINLERLLVVDDAAEFAGHEDGYRYLIEAPTFGRMLCVVIGAPADPPYLDLPKAADAGRLPVLWVGDARGVGWRIGWANTTRLAFSDTDPDGTATVSNLIESLSSPGVFDEVARALGGFPDHTGAAALLPWARWTLCHLDEPENGELDAADAPDDPPDDDPAPRRRRRRRPMLWLLLGLCCVVIAVATFLAIRFGRHNVGYLLIDAGCAAGVLLILLSIAYHMLVRRLLLAIAYRILFWRPVSVAAPPTPVGPPEAELPQAAASPAEEVVGRARWMMNVPAADDEFRQLSSPGQLVMLGGDPELARLVRFAPASARPLIGRAIDGDPITWTLASDQLGVIRLVPLKAGLVRLHIT
jgi:hypothetical protein